MGKEYIEWLKYAEDDIITAKTMRKIDSPPMEIVCYHCQQAAEKLLKAFLVLKEEPVLKTHDLAFLNSRCIMLDESFKNISKECFRLTNYGVNTRYPGIMDIITEDMDKAISDADKIKDFVLSRI
jgi:HEPN domain-containing protein